MKELQPEELISGELYWCYWRKDPDRNLYIARYRANGDTTHYMTGFATNFSMDVSEFVIVAHIPTPDISSIECN